MSAVNRKKSFWRLACGGLTTALLVFCAAHVYGDDAAAPTDVVKDLASRVDQGSEQIERLKKVLESKDKVERRDAVRGMLEWNADLRNAACDVVVETLKNDRDPLVILACLEVLTAMGPAAEPAMPLLLDGMNTGFRVGGPESRHFRLRAAWTAASIGENAVEPLEKLLTNRNGTLRSLSALALGHIGPSATSAIPSLVKLLNDEDGQVREDAARGLAGIGVPAVPALVECIQNPNARVKAAAIEVLGKLQFTGAIGEMAWAELAHDVDALVRAKTVSAIGNTHPIVPQWQSIVLPALSDTDEAVRLAAVDAILNQDGMVVSMAPELIKLLSHAEPEVRRNAVYLLQRSERPDFLLLALSEMGTAAPAEEICVALSGMAKNDHAELLGLLKSESPRTRAAAVAGLGAIRPLQSRWAELAAGHLKDPVRSVVMASLASLEQMGSIASEYRGQLRECLRAFEDDAELEVALAKALYSVSPRDADIVSDLATGLTHSSPIVRENAVVYLQRVGQPSRSQLEAVAALSKDTVPAVRLAVADFIGSHRAGGEKGIDTLIALLDDPEADVKAMSASALGRVGRTAAVALPKLQSLIDDQHPAVRAEVARCLSGLRIDGPQMHPILSKALRDQDFTVRFAAMETLRAYRGERKGLFTPSLLTLTGSSKDSQRLGETIGSYRSAPVEIDVFPELLDGLKHDREEVRMAVIEYIAKFGAQGAAAIEPLTEMKTKATNRERPLIDKTLAAIASKEAAGEAK